jgi:hypothetical protein
MATTTVIAAGEAMFSALKNLPCACVFEHPYEPRGERKYHCARCRSTAVWELATRPLAEAKEENRG